MRFQEFLIFEGTLGVFQGFDEVDVEELEGAGSHAEELKSHKKSSQHVDKSKLPPKFPKRPYDDENKNAVDKLFPGSDTDNDGEEDEVDPLVKEGAFPKVGYSPKNGKMGKIMSVSIPPIKTCPKGVPCTVLCYAEKISKRYKNVLESYEKNYQQYKSDPQGFFDDIIETCNHPNGPRYFRWHVGGDIADAQYLQGMMRVAEKCKSTKFLAYTKQYDLVNAVGSVPKNLSILFSGWPGYPMENPHIFPVAWMKPKGDKKKEKAVVAEAKSKVPSGLTEDRIPENAFHCDCTRSCDQCLKCWHWKKGASLYFDQH